MLRPASPPARLLHAPPTLGALIRDYRSLLSLRGSDADMAATAEQICRSLRSLSQAELEALELAAQGMPAEPMRAGAGGEGIEDEDADPVGPRHA